MVSTGVGVNAKVLHLGERQGAQILKFNAPPPPPPPLHT